MDTQEEFEREIKDAARKMTGDHINPSGGACYVQRGTFRTCFDNVSASDCETIAHGANAVVTAYVPGQACQL